MGEEPTSTVRRSCAVWPGDLYIAPQGLEVTGGSRQLELAKGEPVALADADLTFMHFETQGMGEDHGMTVLAHVRVRHGGHEEVVALPYMVGQDGPQAAAVEPGLTPGLRLTLQRMSVEAGTDPGPRRGVAAPTRPRCSAWK